MLAYLAAAAALQRNFSEDAERGRSWISWGSKRFINQADALQEQGLAIRTAPVLSSLEQ